MNHPKSHKLFLLLLIGVSSHSFALTSDRTKPLYVHSDSVSYNQQKHRVTYIGHVRATQGTTSLTGNKLIVYYSPKHNITQVNAYGKLAHYRSLEINKEKAKNIVYAEAKKISYNPLKNTVLLLRKAKVTRQNNSFTGPHIWYDIANGVVRSTPSNRQKTIIVVQPQA